MVNSSKKVIIKDSTLREGLDVPDVDFSLEQKLKFSKLLDRAKVAEIEIVAPGKVEKDLTFAKVFKEEGLQIKTSGLIYAYRSLCREQIEKVSGCLDRFDLLMPVSLKRKPYDREAKIACLLSELDYSLECQPDVGVGFPHSTQTETEFLVEISKEAEKSGAKRVTLYDTNGSADPFTVYGLVKQLKEHVHVPLFFHGHNDLGLATANSLSAVYAGADGLDVTVNGLGDRAGNASLEQVVMCLHLKGIHAGIIPQDLRMLSRCIEKESGVEVHRLSPIVGEDVFCHKSPAHLKNPELFEPFDPRLIGSERSETDS